MANAAVRILVADDLEKTGLDILAAAGFEVIRCQGLGEDDLCGAIVECHGLIVRSATTVTARAIAAGRQLRLIGRAGIGIDNIDVKAATRAGIVVQNTPHGNVTSAAEHALALLFALARKVPRADRSMKDGKWDKKGCTGVELCGKTLGVVGLGKVGALVARVAKSLDMQVLVADPYLTDHRATELGVSKVTLEVLLARADFVSLHAPGTAETRGLINRDRLKTMKKTARLVNTARGSIVNEADLATALREGTIAGAALDVFEEEPLAADSPLRHLENAVLTPHLGASTAEAQTRVAADMARQFVDFFREGVIRNAVNLDVRINPRLAPYSRLAAILGQMAAQLVTEPVQRLRVSCHGRLSSEDTGELRLSGLKGLLDRTTGDPVTLVNAPLIAEARGIEVVEYKSDKSPTYASLLTLEVETSSSRRVVSGTCFDDEARIVQIDEFLTDVKPAESLLLMFYPDQPGMVGRFGTILGEADINIADMAVGRREKRGRAVVILTLDDPVPAPVLQRIRDAVRVDEMHAITIVL